MLASSHPILWPVLMACSATADRLGLLSLKALLCSFSLSFSDLPVSPMYELSHSVQDIL